MIVAPPSETEPASDLFLIAGMDLARRAAPRPALCAYLMARYEKRRVPLVIPGGAERKGRAPELQLELRFPPVRSRLVIFVSKRRRGYLDFGVFDVFRDVPAAIKAARRLEARGILFLDQLVRCTEDEVRTLSRADDNALHAMRRRLAIVGFRFGMDIPRDAEPPAGSVCC